MNVIPQTAATMKAGRLRTEQTCLRWQSRKTGRFWALYEVRVAESINSWGLPTQVLILWKKINFPSSFLSVQSTLTYIARDHVYTYFTLPTTCCWVLGAKTEKQLDMNLLGRAKENSRMFWVSTGPIFYRLLSLSQVRASFPDTCGSLPNADLSCRLCLQPNLTGYFKITWALIISLVISIVSLLRWRVWGQFMFWDMDKRVGISYVKWNTREVFFVLEMSKDPLDVIATGNLWCVSLCTNFVGHLSQN